MDSLDLERGDSSYPQSPVTQAPAHAPAAGTRVAMLIGALAFVTLAGFLGLRVKQALDKREALAGERTHAQVVAADKPAMQIIRPVETMYRPHIEVTGTLRPWRDADVGFALGGRLVSLQVATGQIVKAGQTLAVLDGSSAAAQVSQAEAASHVQEAQLALAEDNLRRTEALVASRSIPEAQAEQARQQVKLARAQLEGAGAMARLARTGQGDRSIVAPFDGLVTKAPTAAGSVVQPGAPLVHLEDLSRLRLSASVGEDDALLVKLGAPVKVATRDRSVIGRISAIIPSLDQATRRAPIEVEVPNDPKAPLLAWSFVHAAIEGGAEVPALRIPATARRPGSQSEVIKLVDGHARIVRVIHAIGPDGAWLVRDGLAPSDVILAAPDGDVKEGDAIEKTELAK
jgi:RND family efflux transporter MFP subunit